MENLEIKHTASTPLVRFDKNSNTVFIVGESYPENSFEFYSPVVSWFKKSLLELTALTIDITIIYMNSSSTKCMLDLLDLMEEAYGRCVKTAVIWRYDSENPRSYELAEDFCEEVSFPFTIEVLTTRPTP